MLFDTTPAKFKNIFTLLVFPNLVHFLKVKFHVSFYINRDIWTGDSFEYSSTKNFLNKPESDFFKESFFRNFLAKQFDADKTN